MFHPGLVLVMEPVPQVERDLSGGNDRCVRGIRRRRINIRVFWQDAFQGREDNTQELSHDHDTVLGESVVSGIRHLVFDKQKNTPWVERNRAKAT